MRANETVADGNPVKLREGETFSPSHVYSRGIDSLARNAPDETRNDVDEPGGGDGDEDFAEEGGGARFD